MPSLTTYWNKAVVESPIFTRPSKTATKVGLLPAIISSNNRGEAAGFIPQYETRGKKRTAKFKYQQRVLRSSVQNTVDNGAVNYCTQGNAPVLLEAEQDVTKDIRIKFTIPQQDIRNYEEDFDRIFRSQIELSKNALLEELNGACVANTEGLRGNTSAGNTTALSAQGFTSLTTRTVNAAFGENVREEFDKLSYSGDKIIVGGGIVPSYFRMLAKGADNSERGQRMTSVQVDDFMFYQDNMLDAELSTVLGSSVSNQAFIMRPSSIQMLEWFQNVGDFRVMKDEWIDDTITLSIPIGNDGAEIPIKFDISMRWEKCERDTMGLTVTLEKYFDFWTFPSDSFAVGDPLRGTNGVERWNMTAG